MPEYLLSVYLREGQEPPPEEELQQIYDDVEALNDEFRDAGVWVFAGGLHPPETATVVQMQDGDVLTTDGPFAGTNEFVGGFWVIEVEDLDAALAWAARATEACRGPVEVRPFQEEPAD